MYHTILVIDDSSEVRENTGELLELAGYKVLMAKNGLEGLDVAKRTKPDLILCDIMMPGLDGYGVLRALENIPEMAGTPFVFFSAKSDREDFRKGMDLGADDYLTKPFSGDDLLKVVGARLKKRDDVRRTLEHNQDDIAELVTTIHAQGEFSQLAAHRTVKKFKKKEVIYEEGSASGFLYFIVSGKIKIFKLNESGKEYIIDIRKSTDFFGCQALLEGTPYRESAASIEVSEIALIPRHDFFQLFYSNREVATKFIQILSSNFSEAEERLLKLAYNSARKRVAEALLFVFSKYSTDDKINLQFILNRENISAIAGIAPESVSRNLSDFKEEGLIETENGNIKILDLQRLQSLKN